MKRAILLLLFTLFVPRAHAYNWSVIDSGPYQNVHAVTQADGRRMLVAVSALGDLWTFDEFAAGQPWLMLVHGHPNNVLLGEPIIPVAEANGRVVVFAHGDDHNIYSLRQTANGGWGTWQQIPIAVDTYAVAKNAAGPLELFTLERQPVALVRRQQSFIGADTWIDPVVLEAAQPLQPILGAAAHENGRIEVFIVFGDGHVRGRRQVDVNSNQYEPWRNYASPLTPDVHDLQLTTQFGRLSLFLLYGGWYSLAYRQEDVPNGTMTGPVQLWGHSLRTGFRATTSRDDRLHAFVIGGDTKLYMVDQAASGGPWNNWSDTGILAKAFDVSPLNSAVGDVDLFAIDPRGRLMHGRE